MTFSLRSLSVILRVTKQLRNEICRGLETVVIYLLLIPQTIARP
jgi:hypothetical protein